MTQRRMLRHGSEGKDVMEAKQRLLALGCYTAKVTAVKTDIFGDDTAKAVKVFQSGNGLIADGIIGPLTWAVLFPEEGVAADMPERGQMPQQIGNTAATAICAALGNASETRPGLCSTHCNLPMIRKCRGNTLSASIFEVETCITPT